MKEPQAKGVTLEQPFAHYLDNTLHDQTMFCYKDRALVIAYPWEVCFALTNKQGYVIEVRGLMRKHPLEEFLHDLRTTGFLIYAPLVPHSIKSWNLEQNCYGCTRQGPNCLRCYQRHTRFDIETRKEIRTLAYDFLDHLMNDSRARNSNQLSFVEDQQDKEVFLRCKLRTYIMDLKNSLEPIGMIADEILQHLETYGDDTSFME